MFDPLRRDFSVRRGRFAIVVTFGPTDSHYRFELGPDGRIVGCSETVDREPEGFPKGSVEAMARRLAEEQTRNAR